MRRHLHFFATRDDLLPALRGIEERIPIKYTLHGNFHSKAPVFESADELPDFGRCNRESSTGSTTYMVSHRKTEIRTGKIAATGKRYFDQRMNPGTIMFTPGGWWARTILISGNVATICDDDEAQLLMKEFVRFIKKRTKRIRAFWVGREAEAFLDNGGRLTFAAQSPPEYNLSRESPK